MKNEKNLPPGVLKTNLMNALKGIDSDVSFPEIRPFKIRVGQARQSGRVRINY